MRYAGAIGVPTVWIAVNSSSKKGNRLGGHKRDTQDGINPWAALCEKSGQWIADSIGSDYHWCVCQRDIAANREMIARLYVREFVRSEGAFAQKNAFIERT